MGCYPAPWDGVDWNQKKQWFDILKCQRIKVLFSAWCILRAFLPLSVHFLQPKEWGWASDPFQPQPAFVFLGSEDPSRRVVGAVFSGGNLATWLMLSNVLWWDLWRKEGNQLLCGWLASLGAEKSESQWQGIPSTHYVKIWHLDECLPVKGFLKSFVCCN